MSLDVYLLPPDRVAGLASRAGLTVQATLVRRPENARDPQACLLVRKPVPRRPPTGVGSGIALP
ncbi:hypothetical protein [Streptomyces sp. CB02923]|uniref:hypothetical protein n=1 Tax=Streptomyces sp. CB02923 TaxID=1718985 RepID=UPI001A8D79DF|nr:hypothetical protein [Streptomyces sp. CB02923]